jgi:hypothetical protein
MRCDAFENRLQHLLDERQCPEGDDVLAEHAADCPHCRDVLDAQAGLFDTVRDWSVANLDVDLVSRVVARVSTPAPATSAATSRGWWQAASARWIALAVAGALIVMAWKGYDGARTAERSSRNIAEPRNESDIHVAPRQLLPSGPVDFTPYAREAAEGIGSRLALGVHYLHRGRSAVTDVLRGHFSWKAQATPGERSSSLLLNVTRTYALS